MPLYPVPVLRVARLAVDERQRGRRLGSALLRYAIELAEKMRDELGCVGLLVDAKPDAISFYEQYGFVRVNAVEGEADRRPRPSLLYLPLGAVPEPR